MEGFFDGLEQAVRDKNWHAALVMALTLPDICAKATDPNKKTSRKRYAAWFDEYLRPRYTHNSAVLAPQVFLTGDDCYALRCALLHEGSTDITGQPARKVLERFSFCAPGERGNSWHRNIINDTLVLMIDEFATDVLAATRSWWASLADAERAAARERQLTLIDADAMDRL